LFQAHGNSSIKVLEQTIAPFSIEKEIVEPELDKYNSWLKGIFDYNSRAAKEFANREIEELKIADKIVCASSFVADSIQKLGVQKEKVSILPYGVNLDFFKPTTRDRKVKNRKLKVLTVGKIGIRKGIQYTYEAAKKMQDLVEFTAVGPIDLSEEGVKEISKYVKIVPSVSKTELLKYYNDADVFLLPSLCEGSATVVYEALACQLPIITTINSGTIITDGVEGNIIEIKSSSAIEETLSLYLNNEYLVKIISNTKSKAIEGSFESYKSRLKNFFERIND